MTGTARQRWETPSGRDLADEILARLVAGRPLTDLPLDEVNGRADLRGLPAPAPRRLARFEEAGWFAERLGNLLTMRAVTWRGLDLTGAFLDSLRFHDCVIEDCVFDRARCHDWRMWTTTVRNGSFRQADLRESALGPWSQGTGNRFADVDFTQADLREGAWITAMFSDSDFSGARLDKVQFLRSGLARCRFAGVLSETVFDGRVFDAEEHAPNTAEDVDMSAAVLRLVEFRGFDLDGVRLPDDPALRVIRKYDCVLDSAVSALASKEDKTSRVLRAVLQNEMRGISKGARLGLFNRNDFVLLGGEEGAAVADALIREAEDQCRSR